MTVRVSELLVAAAARQAALAGESAGYILLAVADQVAAAPRAVLAEAVELSDEGAVRLSGGLPCDEAEAEQKLRDLLAALLDAASSITPALVRVAGKRTLTGLSALVAELEAALIPVNRAAARRGLARLAREASRAVASGLPAAPVQPLKQTEPALRVPPAAQVVAPTPVAAPIAAPGESALEQPLEEPTEEPIEVTIELTPEPLVETRPEPLARRVAAPPMEQPTRTPRLGTIIAPLGDEVLHEIGETTDPMPDVEEARAEPTVPEPPPEPRLPRHRPPQRSELDSLLQSFASSVGPSEPELRGELKKLAGLELTPAPAPTADSRIAPDSQN
jgi:hypothetical protein